MWRKVRSDSKSADGTGVAYRVPKGFLHMLLEAEACQSGNVKCLCFGVSAVWCPWFLFFLIRGSDWLSHL